MSAAYHLTAYRCDVTDTYNPNGCPVEEVHRSWVEAKANGWTGTKDDSACPSHSGRSRGSDV